ncbi:MAG TPA: universal stress protein [Trebonia sp.]|jgi:nucleotide-binding universal stress UspA family protein
MPGIIVGIDGSSHSRRALKWAISEAAMRRVPLTVLSVNQAIAGFWGGAAESPGDAEFAEHARKVAQEETDSVLEEFAPESRPPAVTVEAVTGIPAEEILAWGKDADMIVVGSRGAGGFKKLLLGSVSVQVAHHAHVPVVVIPADIG